MEASDATYVCHDGPLDPRVYAGKSWGVWPKIEYAKTTENGHRFDYEHCDPSSFPAVTSNRRDIEAMVWRLNGNHYGERQPLPEDEFMAQVNDMLECPGVTSAAWFASLASRQDVTTLADEQRARCDAWAARWHKVGEDCTRANFPVAAYALRGCLQAGGLDTNVIVATQSPIGMLVAGQVADFCQHQRAAGYGPVFAPIRQQKLPEKSGLLWEPRIIAAAREGVRAVYGDIAAALYTDDMLVQLVDHQLEHIRDNCANWRGGNLWAPWHAYVTFFMAVCGWRHEILKPYLWDCLAALNAGQSWLGLRALAISDRPVELHITNESLHNENGPAARWSDDWSFYYLNGVLVDEQLVLRPETQTVQQILDEPNADLRRLRIAQLGPAKWLAAIGATCIHIDRRSQHYRALLQDSRGELWLAGTDGSQRDMRGEPHVYMMPVPPGCTTCAEAHTRISGVDDADCVAEC